MLINGLLHLGAPGKRCSVIKLAFAFILHVFLELQVNNVKVTKQFKLLDVSLMFK